MFSYQHLYHAGSLADVHKHALLSVLLTTLAQKERPISYLETHGGRGAYDVSCPEALKTGEAANGVLKLLAEGGLDPQHPYLQALFAHQASAGPMSYPGSPLLAQFLLRPQDQLSLMECHPQEIQHLRRNMRGPNVHVHQRDGYEGVLSLCPPTPRRGLVFIDPTYEDKNEYEKVVTFTQKLHAKWPQGVIVVWYPLLRAGHQERLQRTLKKSGLVVDVWDILFPRALVGYGLLGSGLYILNAPYGTCPALQQTHDALVNWLQED